MDEGKPVETVNIDIKLDQHGRGTVLVNGEDWSNRVKAIHLESEAAGLTLVGLTVWATNLHIEAPAAVHVTNVHMHFDAEVKTPDG